MLCFQVEKLEAENEGEEELLNQVVEAVGAMVKKYQSFIPHFANTFYPMCLGLLGDGYGDVEKRLALCAFDDFVEHGVCMCVRVSWAMRQSCCAVTNEPCSRTATPQHTTARGKSVVHRRLLVQAGAY